MSTSLAIGGFCIGIVATISANNALTEITLPAAAPAVMQQRGVADLPVYAAAPTSAPTLAAPAEIKRPHLSGTNRPSLVAAPVPPGVDPDRRDAATDGRSVEARFAPLPAAASAPVKNQSTGASEIAKPLDGSLAKTNEPDAGAAVREPPANPPKPKVVKKRREQPANHAARHRNGPFFPFFGFGNGPFFGQRG